MAVPGEDRRGTWNSLPLEIKQKVLKYVPLNVRIARKQVCKQFRDIVADLNHLETKLVLMGVREQPELPYQANMVCSIASHKFDRTLILHVPLDFYDQQLLEIFPNVIAIHDTRHYSDFGRSVNMWHKLEHFSCSKQNFLYYTKSEPKKWSCLRDLHHSPSPLSMPNLQFFHGYISNNAAFGEYLKRGLIGYSMKGSETRSDLILRYAKDTQILYDVNFESIDLSLRMPKLSAICASGETSQLRRLVQLEGITKLVWNHLSFNEETFRNALMPWGHRLQSFRVGTEFHPEIVIRAVVQSCPNLVELHINPPMQKDRETDCEYSERLRNQIRFKRNSVREFQALKSLTKLKTLSIDFSEVDVKFLNMFDMDLNELQSITEHEEWPMTIKQLIYYQHEIKARKSVVNVLVAKNTKIFDLESQLEKTRKYVTGNAACICNSIKLKLTTEIK